MSGELTTLTDDQGRDVRVYAYLSDIDGTPVIEIETYADEDYPSVRVYINDGCIWDHGACHEVL